MHELETIDLGSYRVDDYFLTGFVDPAPVEGREYDPDEDADEYGVVLARSTSVGSNVEVVRLDTAHGRPHLDRLYLPHDAGTSRKIWLDADYPYDRMRRYLLANWRQFVTATWTATSEPMWRSRSVSVCPCETVAPRITSVSETTARPSPRVLTRSGPAAL